MDWFPCVANAVFGILQTAAVAGVAVVCPPLAPVVGGALSIGGELINHELCKITGGADVPGAPARGISEEQFAAMQAKLDDFNKNVEANQQHILDNQKYILGNRDLIKGIKKMINVNAMENRRMMKEMSADLKNFESNVDQNFVELKNFLVEREFVEQIQLPLIDLWKKMEIAAEKQSNYTIDDFLNVYKEKPARRILDNVVSKLHHSYTDPISSAMGANALNSRIILNHYLHILSQLIAKVIAIEGFHHGLTGRNAEYMKELSEHIDSNIVTIRDFFLNVTIPKEKYWPDAVTKRVGTLNVDSDPVAIADNIKKELEGIFTKDVFTIFVFLCLPSESCAPAPVPLENGAIGMVGGANSATNVQALVLRSETYRTVSAKNNETLVTTFRSMVTARRSFKKDECDEETMGVFGSQLKDNFVKEEKPHGFVVCHFNGTVEERLTNNGVAIIPAAERSLCVGDIIYYGLSWV